MNDFNYYGIDDDEKILGIGPYFRPVNGKLWKVRLILSSGQSGKSISVFNATLIVRGRVINPVNKRGDLWEQHGFQITDTADWEIGTIGACPVRRHEDWEDPNQLCFIFSTVDGITFYLPQFELARALFFHGIYLSKTAIESECLRSEFSVVIDHEDNVLIRVSDSSEFQLAHLNDPVTRNYLSWLLLNADMLKSYESITRYQRTNGFDNQRHRVWNFQFDPPPLRGVKVGIRGQYSREHNACIVYEIFRLHDLPNEPHKSLGMWHPKFKRSMPGAGHVSLPAGGKSETLTVHDDLESNPNIKPVHLDAEKVSITFKHPFHVTKVATEKQKQGTSEAKKESETGLKSVSTNDGYAGRGLPGGDWNTLEDETDYGKFFESKFNCFRELVDVLIEHHGCKLLHTEITELRKVGKSQKHLLSTDGTPRAIADVAMRVGPKTIHLLEVDTSDAEQSLSTQVLVVRDEAAWGKDIESVKVELVRSSLRWPTKLLKDLCGEGRHKGVHHPQAPSGNKSVLPPHSITGWADRIYGWMRHLAG
ncbi:Tn7-like element transposition protein TnsE [Pseudodesulfovibrio indicus]|uniref:Transposase n=1 Tax=Pseudodesulfovibrio indicus TaxID=1716143 RepID=A0A126QTF9_9BACT|nr:Tn7-like element transposition protein TnsE [Pseudodesulfovibrio indicus]AMK13046.1 transposase [Pseudodesulfovibrio indicus]TDT91011.1 hypothetical protein EDC59_102446 [Pseudodesulfovibrio indicus]